MLSRFKVKIKLVYGFGKDASVFTAGETETSGASIATTSANKVILDCDMGYVNDDAFALMLLLQADELEYIDLLGVAVSSGNKIGAVAVNATLLQLEEVSRTDIPVYIGEDVPLNGFNAQRAALSSYPGEAYADLDKYISPEYYHDLGDFYSEAWGYSQTEAQREAAADFIVEQVKKYPGEITILCTGPTTNVARACLQDETFAENVTGIIYMGGNKPEKADADTTVADNENIAWRQQAESSFNWRYDADAVKVCLESSFPRQIVCTDEIADTMNIPSDFVDSLTECEDSPVADFFSNHKAVANANKKLWDVVIPAVFLCPDLITESEEVNVFVSLEDADYGCMLKDDKGTGVTVVSGVDGAAVYELMGMLYSAGEK